MRGIKLLQHQSDALHNILTLLSDNTKKVLVEMATGTGKTAVISYLAESLLKNNENQRILILSIHREEVLNIISSIKQIGIHDCVPITDHLYHAQEHRILVTTYQDLIKNFTSEISSTYQVVLCDNAHYTNGNKIKSILENLSMPMVGFVNGDKDFDRNNVFYNAPYAYKYTYQQAVNDGLLSPLTEQNLLEDFCQRLFAKNGYEYIDYKSHFGWRSIRPDIVIKGDDKYIVIEAKYYRGRTISTGVLNTSVEQLLHYRNYISQSSKDNFTYILMLFCEISPQVKKEIEEKHKISIWDMSNILYLSGGDVYLSTYLSQCLPYLLTDITPKKPNGWWPDFSTIKLDSSDYMNLSNHSVDLQERLINCPTGKEGDAAGDYEDICADVWLFLFDSEFTRKSIQHETDDTMFRMDMLCGLKGSSEFWNFLIRFYNTKFVVLEFKNYTDAISQNLIYITEKYLFSAALRNVAFITSRKGFHANAKKAALGCLRENGKLIIDITDNDLINMIKLKEEGNEPSDYLMEKVEKFLMSISK